MSNGQQWQGLTSGQYIDQLDSIFASLDSPEGESLLAGEKSPLEITETGDVQPSEGWSAQEWGNLLEGMKKAPTFPQGGAAAQPSPIGQAVPTMTGEVPAITTEASGLTAAEPTGQQELGRRGDTSVDTLRNYFQTLNSRLQGEGQQLQLDENGLLRGKTGLDQLAHSFEKLDGIMEALTDEGPNAWNTGLSDAEANKVRNALGWYKESYKGKGATSDIGLGGHAAGLVTGAVETVYEGVKGLGLLAIDPLRGFPTVQALYHAHTRLAEQAELDREAGDDALANFRTVAAWLPLVGLQAEHIRETAAGGEYGKAAGQVLASVFLAKGMKVPKVIAGKTVPLPGGRAVSVPSRIPSPMGREAGVAVGKMGAAAARAGTKWINRRTGKPAPKGKADAEAVELRVMGTKKDGTVVYGLKNPTYGMEPTFKSRGKKPSTPQEQQQDYIEQVQRHPDDLSVNPQFLIAAQHQAPHMASPEIKLVTGLAQDSIFAMRNTRQMRERRAAEVMAAMRREGQTITGRPEMVTPETAGGLVRGAQEAELARKEGQLPTPVEVLGEGVAGVQPAQLTQQAQASLKRGLAGLEREAGLGGAPPEITAGKGVLKALDTSLARAKSAQRKFGEGVEKLAALEKNIETVELNPKLAPEFREFYERMAPKQDQQGLTIYTYRQNPYAKMTNLYGEKAMEGDYMEPYATRIVDPETYVEAYRTKQAFPVDLTIIKQNPKVIEEYGKLRVKEQTGQLSGIERSIYKLLTGLFRVQATQGLMETRVTPPQLLKPAVSGDNKVPLDEAMRVSSELSAMLRTPKADVGAVTELGAPTGTLSGAGRTVAITHNALAEAISTTIDRFTPANPKLPGLVKGLRDQTIEKYSVIAHQKRLQGPKGVPEGRKVYEMMAKPKGLNLTLVESLKTKIGAAAFDRLARTYRNQIIASGKEGKNLWKDISPEVKKAFWPEAADRRAIKSAVERGIKYEPYLRAPNAAKLEQLLFDPNAVAGLTRWAKVDKAGLQRAFNAALVESVEFSPLGHLVTWNPKFWKNLEQLPIRQQRMLAGGTKRLAQLNKMRTKFNEYEQLRTQKAIDVFDVKNLFDDSLLTSALEILPVAQRPQFARGWWDAVVTQGGLVQNLAQSRNFLKAWEAIPEKTKLRLFQDKRNVNEKDAWIRFRHKLTESDLVTDPDMTNKIGKLGIAVSTVVDILFVLKGAVDPLTGLGAIGVWTVTGWMLNSPKLGGLWLRLFHAKTQAEINRAGEALRKGVEAEAKAGTLQLPPVEKAHTPSGLRPVDTPRSLWEDVAPAREILGRLGPISPALTRGEEERDDEELDPTSEAYFQQVIASGAP